MFTGPELWTTIHGIGFGAIFLLAFSGGLVALYYLRPELVTVTGIKEQVGRIRAGVYVMAAGVWATVITGTYIIYPFYRAEAPAGADLAAYPKFALLADSKLAFWHTFGMEWKEHIAWVAPIMLTGVAYVIARYGLDLARQREIRRAVIVLFTAAFIVAGVAGLLGALITRAAPVR